MAQRYTARPLLIILAALALTLLLMIACGGAAEPTPQPATPVPPTAASPTQEAVSTVPAPTAVPVQGTVFDTFPSPRVEGAQRGGVLRVARPSDVRFLDPHTSDDPNHTQWQMYSGLVNYDWTQPETTIVPDLATSWSASEDGLTWTFHLHEGAVFHDGALVVANDVIQSMHRHYQHPARESAVAPFLEDQVQTMAAPDDHTLELTIGSIRPDMIPLFANNNFAVLPAALIDELGGPASEMELDESHFDRSGSGPYSFVRHDLGVVFETESFADYYNADQVYLDGIQYFTFNDEATRNAAFIARQVDLYWGTGNSVVQQEEAKKQRPDCAVNQAPNCALYGATRGTRMFWMMLNPADERFQDFRVRKAIHLSLDRWDTVAKVELGQGDPILSAPPDFGGLSLDQIGASGDGNALPGFRKNKEEDWAEARALLTEAGLLGTQLTFLGATNANTRAAMEAYMQGLEKGGFTTAVDQPPDDATRQLRESACDFEIIMSRIGPDFADPGAYLVMWEKGQPQNRCDIPFPKLWDLHAKQATNLNAAERKAIVAEMTDILLNDEQEGLWAIFTHTLGHPYSYDPKVHWSPPKVLRGFGRYLNIWLEQ